MHRENQEVGFFPLQSLIVGFERFMLPLKSEGLEIWKPNMNPDFKLKQKLCFFPPLISTLLPMYLQRCMSG